MSLLHDSVRDTRDIIESPTGVTNPILFTSPPPDNTEFGTLDPDDEPNIIRGWPKDHYTQLDPDTGIPQAGLNASVSISLKTLLDEGIIDDIETPDLVDWKIAWLDPTNDTRRDFLVNKIIPTNSLGYVVIILGEFEQEEVIP